MVPEGAMPINPEENDVAMGTSEILTCVTISINVINSILLSVSFSSVDTNTVIIRDVLSLLSLAITHISWILISQKIRQFTSELITTIRNWFNI